MKKRISAIELITEVSGEDARRLVQELAHPSPNPAAERLIAGAKKLTFKLQDL